VYKIGDDTDNYWLKVDGFSLLVQVAGMDMCHSNAVEEFSPSAFEQTKAALKHFGEVVQMDSMLGACTIKLRAYRHNVIPRIAQDELKAAVEFSKLLAQRIKDGCFAAIDKNNKDLIDGVWDNILSPNDLSSPCRINPHWKAVVEDCECGLKGQTVPAHAHFEYCPQYRGRDDV
jgi:hypothetical protein